MAKFDQRPRYGERIVQYMASERKTQRWLAEQCDITQGMVSSVVNGRATPSLALAVKICRALQCSVDEIFYDIV